MSPANKQWHSFLQQFEAILTMSQKQKNDLPAFRWRCQTDSTDAAKLVSCQPTNATLKIFLWKEKPVLAIISLCVSSLYYRQKFDKNILQKIYESTYVLCCT
jgi:hypothetical protein